MDENFGQKFYSGTAKRIYTVAHEVIRLLKWMAFYDKNYENIYYFDLMASNLSTFK